MLGETDEDTDDDGDTLGLTELETEGLTLLDTDDDIELEGDTEGLTDDDTDELTEGLTDELTLLEGDAVAGRIPNTTPVLPASIVDVVAHVRDAMLAPSVVSPSHMPIEQSLPALSSTSILSVQSGFVSLDIAAANAVASLP